MKTPKVISKKFRWQQYITPQSKLEWVLATIVIILLLTTITLTSLYIANPDLIQNNASNNVASVPKDTSHTETTVEESDPFVPIDPRASIGETDIPKPEYTDPIGTEISYQLQQNGYNLGFIHSPVIRDLQLAMPEFTPTQAALDSGIKPVDPLDTIIPRPDTSQPLQYNLLEYPKYGITAPIKYATFYDLFGTNPDGTINFTADPGGRNNGTETPVQKLLEQGIVHMGFSPMPGEIGNSYIVGHTSNFAFVRSDYNTIFAPLNFNSAPGDEFFITDPYGRRLKFRVFESLEIRETDVVTAYKLFPGRRVVTLQGSVLERINGVNVPSKRWLTRGELVIE